MLRRHQRNHQTLRRAVLLDEISTITDGLIPGIEGSQGQARGPYSVAYRIGGVSDESEQ